MAEALGVVPTDGRGSLPFALLDNEPLVSLASWTLDQAGVELLDFDVSWSDVVARDLPLVVHDPHCPGAPAAFVRSALETAVSSKAVVVGVRPVTDTVKELRDDLVGQTVDRSSLVSVCSPVVLPAGVVAVLEGWPDLHDVPGWVDQLRQRYPVTFLPAPPEARRIADESDLELLRAEEASEGRPEG